MINVDGAVETKYHYFHDALGSVVALLNNNGVVIEGYSCDSFGKTKIHTAAGADSKWLTSDDSVGSASSVANSFMFTARQFDAESGLYYYRARYYSPDLGRFLSPDPIGYADSTNLYQYCLNNPINWIDPLGLDVWVESHGLHKNVNIGDPQGSYRSWSYRVKGNTVGQAANNLINPLSSDYHEGVVYEDPRQQGKIDEKKHLETTPEQDKEMTEEMESMEGSESGYDFWDNNCRGFSDEVFDAFKDRFDTDEKNSK